MRPDPIDFDSPLGISKREWVKVLGVNLALLLIVYTVALVCTLCGNDFFAIGLDNPKITEFANKLNDWNIYPLVAITFATIEETLMVWFICLKRPKWWIPLTYFAVRVLTNLIVGLFLPAVPYAIALGINIIFCLIFVFTRKKRLKPLIRFGLVIAISLLLNVFISMFRTKVLEMNHTFTEVAFIYLSVEYDLAFGLVLALLALAIPWEKGEPGLWSQTLVAGGSSPSMTKCSPKPSKIATNNLPPKYRKRLRLLKAKVMAIQTIGLIVIATLPWFTGRPVEFALVYASFCITRLMLGFNRSLHFKSETVCVTSGALVFWALTFLTPNVETSIILSLAYGAGLALGFRLYWELHDLMMYRKACKTDRYAMLYVVFKRIQTLNT